MEISGMAGLSIVLYGPKKGAIWGKLQLAMLASNAKINVFFKHVDYIEVLLVIEQVQITLSSNYHGIKFYTI